jgi:kynureninase
VIDRPTCLARDLADPLARFRPLFHHPPDLIYLEGNSLGMMPKAVPARLDALVSREWADGLIRSWNDAGWWDMPLRIGAKIARLIGAHPDEVAATDSTSVNLFKLLAAATQLRPGRRVILTDPDNFPTDLYIADGLVNLLPGYELRLRPVTEIAASLDETIAVVTLSHVDYKTAAIHDMPAITRAAHAAGALALWDLSHSAGAVSVGLAAAGADLAVGCGYKYLNGGPGAPAYLYVRRDHQEKIRAPISGWWGHAEPFAFLPRYAPAPGIARMLCGTQSPLAMAALDTALDLWADVDLALLDVKRAALTDLFITLVERDCPDLRLASPRDPAARASHVSFRHEDGYAVMQALRAAGVIGDFRSPDLLRFGFTPLYIGYVDVFDAATRLALVMREEGYRRAEFRRPARVT